MIVPEEPEGEALDYIVDVATTKRALNNDPDIARHCIQEGETTVDLKNLPLNGTNVYVRVWYKKLNGDWVYNDYELETEARTPATRYVTRSYVIKDHLDTPRFIYDDEQTQTWRWVSDGFGNQAANDDVDQDGVQTNFNLKFAGQYYDQETGLHYNWNRYYDPATDRYITSDPIGLEGGMNTYVYANANPLKYVDPDGRVAFLAPLIPAFAGGGGAAAGTGAVALTGAGKAAVIGAGLGVILSLPGDTSGNGNVVPFPGNPDIPADSCPADSDGGDPCEEWLEDLLELVLAIKLGAVVDDLTRQALNNAIKAFKQSCPHLASQINPV